MACVSWVATLMLSVDVFEDDAAVDEFSEWLRTAAPRRESPDTRGVGFLDRLDTAQQGWGGWKHPEVRLWGGVLNHADLPAVVKHFEHVPWRCAQSVQLMIMDQEQFAFRLWMLQNGRAVQCVPMPEFGPDGGA
jgi:hypothetical protein